MVEHTVTAFDDDLKSITRKVVEMGGHAESMIARAVAALVKADRALAEVVVAEDLVLDKLQYELDERVILLIARRQPMATDLREIIGAMRMGNDLERIGDMGKNIARRVKDIEDVVRPRKVVRGLEHLTGLALEQLKEVLDAYVNKDAARAREVCEKDDAIDQIYTSLFRELLTYMMEDPRNITFCTHLLFCAKNIERIGDHATNIAETVIYMVTGEAVLSQHGTRAG
ncbi:MAG: phosphate transport system regulatory protein PhoU [Alphaproteobacteria bacterium]|nr:MAG: phosphate transport system regulatory protein PhoU [Alphaproteobacteria bacterium]